MIKILLADDHPVFRFGMRALLEATDGFEIVGEAASGKEVVTLAGELQPDVILMDIAMPEMNGIEATRKISTDHPDIGVLIVTMVDDDSLFAAMRAGARGYLLKGAEGEETLRAIQAVANGEAIFSPTVANRINAFFANAASAGLEEKFPELTTREREILGLIAKGLTNNAIAERLSLSPKTVRNQVSSIFSKLQVADRAAAIIKARNAGLK
jgi:DNA-binding NarL/FixJ family response regulator